MFNPPKEGPNSQKLNPLACRPEPGSYGLSGGEPEKPSDIKSLIDLEFCNDG
jgi:hypothetical protein